MLSASLLLSTLLAAGQADAQTLLPAVTLYASFDQALTADYAPGGSAVQTRFDPQTKGDPYVFEPGYDRDKFQIAKGEGVSGGCLKCTDVLPRRGRLSYPGKGNLAYRDGPWGGAFSVWINGNPDRDLKTEWCDPIQITARSSHDGGIWFDFTPDKPRDMRMGTFPALSKGQKLPDLPEAQQPVYRLSKPAFKSGTWHHVVVTWARFESNQQDGTAQLYLDGKLVGQVKGFDLQMNWHQEAPRIYFAVSYIGLLDELAIFDRHVSAEEVQLLHDQPGLLRQKFPATN